MKKTIKYLIVPTMAIFLLSGCVEQPKPLYSWGNYVASTGEYTIKGHEKEVREKHSAELKNMIEESQSKDMRVPPGIYAEYAQVLFESNQPSEAKKYFLLEKNTYPESTIFIDRVIKKLYGDN